MSKPLDPTSLPRAESYELGIIWHGEGTDASVTFQNSYDPAPRTVQGRAYWNPLSGGCVIVRAPGIDTLVPQNILHRIEPV